MKKIPILIIFNILLLTAFMVASQAEHFRVKARVVKTLSNNETKKILKKYNTKQKYNTHLKYNIGLRIKVISCVAQEGSYVEKKYKKGEILSIIVTTNNKKFARKIKKNKRLILKYNYYDDDTPDGLISRTSWTLIE